MARVTVEDCLANVDNRFQLVLVATKRARQISLGAEPFIEEENDKPTVLALREIAEGHVTRDILDETIEEEILEFVEEGEEGESVIEGMPELIGQASSESAGADAAPSELDALTAALQAELAGAGDSNAADDSEASEPGE